MAQPNELSKMAASNKEEDLISEMLSQQKIEDLSNNENDVSVVQIVARRVAI